MVYRSGHLANISPDDLRTLESWGVRTVIDFRSGKDMAIDGGAPLPPGARRVHAPMGDPARAPTDLRALLEDGEADALERHLGSGQAVEIMKLAARALVLEQREGFARMLRTLAEPEGTPAIIHCSAGKDRTGWGASLLLLIAGAPDDAIVSHYVESNHHRADENARSLARTPAGIDPEWLRPFFEVRREYAEASLATLREGWTDVDAYVVEGLGVAPEALQTLRQRLRAPGKP